MENFHLHIENSRDRKAVLNLNQPLQMGATNSRELENKDHVLIESHNFTHTDKTERRIPPSDGIFFFWQPKKNLQVSFFSR